MKKKWSLKREVYLKRVGATIREARRRRGFSQEALALEADLDRSYIGSVERGERNISLVNLKRISETLGLPLSELLAGL